MAVLTGVIKNGTIVPNEPITLPENAEVEFRLVLSPDGEGEICFDGAPWPQTPAEIQEHLERMDSRKPVMSAREAIEFQELLESEKQIQKHLISKEWTAGGN